MKSGSIESAVEMVARELASADGWGPDMPLTVTQGFTVPMWVAYSEVASRLAQAMKRIKP